MWGTTQAHWFKSIEYAENWCTPLFRNMIPTQVAIILISHMEDFNAYALRYQPYHGQGDMQRGSPAYGQLLADREVIPFSKMAWFSVSK